MQYTGQVILHTHWNDFSNVLYTIGPIIYFIPFFYFLLLSISSWYQLSLACKPFASAYIPLDIAFVLGTQRDQKRDKQHEIYLPNANPALVYPTRTIFHWPALGVTQILGFALAPQSLLDTKFWYSQCKILVFGGIYIAYVMIIWAAPISADRWP